MSDEQPVQGVAERAARQALRDILVAGGDPADALERRGLTIADIGEAINGVLPPELRRRGDVALLVGVIAGQMTAAAAIAEVGDLDAEDALAPPQLPDHACPTCGAPAGHPCREVVGYRPAPEGDEGVGGSGMLVDVGGIMLTPHEARQP